MSKYHDQYNLSTENMRFCEILNFYGFDLKNNKIYFSGRNIGEFWECENGYKANIKPEHKKQIDILVNGIKAYR